MITQTWRIEQVTHRTSGTGPTGLVLALEVAAELHTPARRAPEVVVEAVPAPATLHRNTTTERRHRRTVRD